MGGGNGEGRLGLGSKRDFLFRVAAQERLFQPVSNKSLEPNALGESTLILVNFEVAHHFSDHKPIINSPLR